MKIQKFNYKSEESALTESESHNIFYFVTIGEQKLKVVREDKFGKAYYVSEFQEKQPTANKYHNQQDYLKAVNDWKTCKKQYNQKAGKPGWKIDQQSTKSVICNLDESSPRFENQDKNLCSELVFNISQNSRDLGGTILSLPSAFFNPTVVQMFQKEITNYLYSYCKFLQENGWSNDSIDNYLTPIYGEMNASLQQKQQQFKSIKNAKQQAL